MNEWEIRKAKERYTNMANELPDYLIAFGTKEQAEEAAFRLSNYYSGCDFIFYVVDEENP